MKHIKVSMPDSLAAKFERVAGRDADDAVTDALALYNWVLDEAGKGRVILSANMEGTHFTKLSMPAMDRAHHDATCKTHRKHR